MHKALLQKFFLFDSKNIYFQTGGNQTLTFYLLRKPSVDKPIVIKDNVEIIDHNNKILFRYKSESEDQNLSETFKLDENLSKLNIEDIKFDEFGFLIVTINDETSIDVVKKEIKQFFKVDEYDSKKIFEKEGYKKVFLFIDELPTSLNKITSEELSEKPDENLKLTLKEILAVKFDIKTIDINIKSNGDNFLVVFLTNSKDYDKLKQNIIETGIFTGTDDQLELKLKIDISSGSTLTELSKNIDLLTESISNLNFDFLESYIGETKQTLSKLKDIEPEDIKKIEQIENLFQSFSASLRNTADELIIKTKTMPVMVVPTPEIEDKTSSLLTIFAQISDKIKDTSNLSANEETTLILSEIDNSKKQLEEKIAEIDKTIKEFNDATKAIQNVNALKQYLDGQKKKKVSLCQACNKDYKIEDGYQDMVFYNGTEEQVLKDSYQPMISLPNLIISQNENTNEINDTLISKITEMSIPAAEIDTSNLNKYLSAGQFGGSSYKINYHGGTLESEVGKTNDIIQKTSDLKLLTIRFKKKITEYQDELGKFKLAYVQSFYYSLFIIISINNSILTSSQLIYELLSVGNCQYYLNLVNVILDKIASGDISPAERFFQKYHFLILKDMKLLLEFIIGETKSKKGDITDGVFNGVQSTIIVSKSKGKFASLLSIFNSFKDILDAYKSQVLPPVSVYVRINDWTQDNSVKVANGSNNLPIEIRDESNIIFTRNEADGRFLDVSLDKCSKLHYDQEEKLTIDETSNKYERVYDDVKKVKVEEVLTSKDIPSNEALNKYMSLSSQLQKKDIMLITYGTSGIGKSFALFGGRGNKGLLQSTLSEIRGKPEIYFRTFELYTMGVQYPFYWKERSNIYQRCFTYDFNTNGELDVIGVNMIKSYEEIIGFIKKTQTPYAEGAKFHKINFKQYNNFVDIVEKIDKVRSKDINLNQTEDYPQRIKKTTNNPQSSRSIIIYEFLIQFEADNNKRLVIVDLPGLEDPKISYVENTEFKIEGDGSSKILGASFLMNPIFIPLFKQDYSKAIREFIMKQDIEIKDGWLNTEMITLSNSSQGLFVIRKKKVGLYIDSKFDLTDKASKDFTGDDIYNGPKFDDKNNKNDGDLQRFNNCFVYFILYLINKGKIDVLVDLITFIIQKKGVVEGPITDWESFSSNEVKYTSLKEKIKLAYEGIAINENILGLIYFLISKVEKTSDNGKLYKNPSKGIKSQADISKGPQNDEEDRRVSYKGKDLSDDEMKKYIDRDTRILKETAGEIFAREARTIIKTAYSDDSDPDLNNIKIINKAGQTIATTQTLYKNSVDSYDHQKIFTVPDDLINDEWITSIEVQDRVKEGKIPLIFSYLSPYLGDTDALNWQRFNDPTTERDYFVNKSTQETRWEPPNKGIESVILFTLLTNNDPKKKCLYQINLLRDSLEFLKELVV